MVSKVRELVDHKNGLLNRSIFVDNAIYQQELEQVFGRCWLFVGHESQVPKPNDFTASYMGEDPVLLTRDSKGKLHAFLNMCRHRGNRICRADSGNAPSFMCTYHGWTFATDGKLVGVPGYKEAYFEELDRSQWGLVEAGQIDSYKGLVFATWDKQAPSLIDYLGNMGWYLDLHVDRRAGGSEVLGGIQKWTLNANWKFPADNFGGDGYHHAITHGSTYTQPTIVGQRRPNPYAPGAGVAVYLGNGHGVVGYGGGTDGRKTLTNMPEKRIGAYYLEHYDELEKRLGSTRAANPTMTVGTVFPNMSPHGRTQLRLYHPRGPEKTEMWVFCLVDKDAPKEVKDVMRPHLSLTFGPSGTLEQDDMNNWIQCTTSAKGFMGPRYLMNESLGIGHESKHEKYPAASTAPTPSEQNQRAFYNWWADMMQAPSWAQIKLDPIEKK